MICFHDSTDGERIIHEVMGLLIPRQGDTVRLKAKGQDDRDFHVVNVRWDYTTDVEYHDASHYHPHVFVSLWPLNQDQQTS
jgi:hypothetical protein